jgi:hypothetical protein
MPSRNRSRESISASEGSFAGILDGLLSR